MTATAPSAYEVELFQQLEQELKGRNLAQIGSPHEVARRMAAALPPTDSPWDQVVGPVYTTASLSRFLGISRQAISQAVKLHTILRLITADGVSTYPAFQFGPGGERLPGLRPVLDELSRAVDDPYTWAAWLTAVPDGGESAVGALWAGRRAEVVEAARATATAWLAP
jgi:hypothetical protein